MSSNAQGGRGKAEKIKYDNSLNWYTQDDVQHALDDVRNDNYNLLSALGMSNVADLISISATKNTTTTYTYNIRKGDRFRVKTVYGSGVSYANVSTRVNGTVEERLIQNQSTGQDVMFEALHDADEFAIYSSGGTTNVTITPIVKDINPSIRNITNNLKDTVYGTNAQQETLQLSFVQGGIGADGSANTASQRIRTDFIKVKGDFNLTLSTLKFNIYYYKNNNYNSYERREGDSWLFEENYKGFYNGYIIISEAYTNDTNISPTNGNGTLDYELLSGGLEDDILYQNDFSPTFIEGSLYSGTYNIPASSTAYYKKRIIAVAKAGKKMKVTTQEGYYCSIHEYSAEYTSPVDLVNSTWLGNTQQWFTGELEFTPLAATKTIALICGKGENKDQVIDPSEGTNYDVESAYTISQVLPEIADKANDAEIQLLGIQEAQKTILVTFSLGVWNSNTGIWGTSTTRIASPQIPVDGSTLKFKMDVGYKYSLSLFDENKNILSSITALWVESDGLYHELKGLHGYLTFNVAKNDDSTISTIPDFGFELISLGDHTSVERETDFKTKYNGSRFFYTGAPITLQKRNYWLRYIWGYPTINNFIQQGMAIYGDVAILGSSTQSGTNVKAEVFKISDFSKLASMLLPRGGYSDIHCNVMCFGNVIGSGNLPYLYVSQWNEQKGCFVYDIASDYTATLKQVILPTNVSASLIGSWNIDWVVDTDNNRLISIGYVDALSELSPSNGMQVCIFKLPALTESVVNLTDADVLDSFHIDEFYVRQDCCYNNGNIYMMCGASNTLDYTKIAVINLAGRNVASVIDLKWLSQEPEGIDVYDNSLFIRVINNQQMYRLYFD